MHSLIKTLNTITDVGVALANFIVPLYFKVWPGDSWNLPKTTAISLMAAPITTSAAISFALDPKWSPIMSAASAVAGSWVASAHTSIRPKISIYGSGVRMEGLTQFSTTLSYFLASSSVKNKKLILVGTIITFTVILFSIFNITKASETFEEELISLLPLFVHPKFEAPF